MTTLYEQFPELILFLHIISAVVWIGGMIAMRFAAHHSFMELEPPLRLARTAHALKRLFAIVAPFILILLFTALVMAIGMGLHQSEEKLTVFAKEGLWTVMTVNYLLMVFRRNAAQKLIDGGDMAAAKAKLALIGGYMVPLNIILGIIAIYLGVTLQY